MQRIATAVIGLLLASLAPLSAQVDEVALEALEQIENGVEDHEPERVAEALKDLDDVYEKVSAKTLKKVHRTLKKMFSDFVPREGNSLVRGGGIIDRAELEGTEREVAECYTLAVGILFDKDEGGTLLTDALKRKHVKEWPEVRALIYEGLGYRVDVKLIKDFQKILTDDDAAVAAAGASALGQFLEHDMDVRRDIVESLVEAYAEHHEAMEKEARKAREEVAADYLAVIEVEFDEALSALTRRRFQDAPEWSQWWEEHGDDEEW